MVYNVLKLFMEINPDFFDAVLSQYKQRRIEYAQTSSPSQPFSLPLMKIFPGSKNTLCNNLKNWEKVTPSCP